MIYIKSKDTNITNNYNYNDKAIMILKSKYVVTTLYSNVRFLDKIDNVSGSNVIKKVLH